jgi:hypothetical protein
VPLVDVAGDPRLEARIEAALAEAKAKRLSGDQRGAQEVVLSILAIDDEHAEARLLQTELELALEPPTAKRAVTAWPAAVAPAETPKPLPEPRPATGRPVPAKAAARAPSRGLSRIQLGAIVLTLTVVVSGGVLLMRSPVSRTVPVIPATTSPSLESTARTNVTEVAAEAPPSLVAPPTATPVHPEIDRALQQRVQTEAQRAADEARVQAAAEKAGAAEAQAQARGENARSTHEPARSRAAEAGAETPAATVDQTRRAAVEAPASAPPVTTPPAAPRSEADREAVLAVVKRYTGAMEARDLAAVKAVWPGLSGAQESKIRSAFQFAKSLRMQLDVTDVQLGSGTAVVSCLRRVTIVTTEGQTAHNNQAAVIRLAKTDGWSIEAIQ